jgi:sugar phosphate isomerase/epimerase/type 1 glutamine amidotransferase
MFGWVFPEHSTSNVQRPTSNVQAQSGPAWAGPHSKTRSASRRPGCVRRSWSAPALWTLLLAVAGGVILSAGALHAAEAVLTKGTQGLLTAQPEDRDRIEQALPASATVRPQQPRRLLIFDLNVNYGGHRSIEYANYAFARMGEKTGAYETVISRDPAVFHPETLRQFDAVFFNNTVGNLFTDPALRQSLVEFVYAGGGLIGVHGTSVAFTRWPGAHEDWPEFGKMLGARGASHRESDEHVFIRLDDPGHPVNRVFGGTGFDFRDEFFRFHEPYSRQRVRVLLSIDTDKTDLEQGRAFGMVTTADNDYPVAWIRHYGRGRVFYSTVGHNPYVFWDPTLLGFYLDAVQFALGDLEAPTVPSAKLTPALRAQEQLGWRLGIEAYTFHRFTFFETIERTAQLGLAYVGGLSFQRVSDDIPRNLEPGLTDDEMRQIRLKLDEHGVRLLTYYIQDIPGDEAGCRRVFEFGRQLGIETFMSEPALDALDTIERFADEYDIQVAIHNHDAKGSPHYWHPNGVLRAVEGRSARLGACADLGYWMRAGIDPIEGIRLLGDRLITLQMHDLNELSPDGHDVPWGTGAGRSEAFFRELRRLKVRPVMIGLEYSYNFLESVPDVARSIEFFNDLSLQLAQ